MPGIRQLRMRLHTLEQLPPIILGAGLTLRRYDANDLTALTETLASAFPIYGWSQDRILSELLNDPEVFETFVIDSGGIPIATASCKRTPDHHDTGYLHWCGVHQDFRGAHLGRFVCIAVLEAFAARGMKAAILDTNDFRLPAIKTYLKLGFEPFIRDEEDTQRWAQVMNEIRGTDSSLN